MPTPTPTQEHIPEKKKSPGLPQTFSLFSLNTLLLSPIGQGHTTANPILCQLCHTCPQNDPNASAALLWKCPQIPCLSRSLVTAHPLSLSATNVP